MKPTKVVITESGRFNESGYFQSLGVLGVDAYARNAVAFVVGRHHCLPVQRNSVEVIYRETGSNRGYRLSVFNIY